MHSRAVGWETFDAELRGGESLWFTIASRSLHDVDAGRARAANALIHAFAPVCNGHDEPYAYGTPTGIITGEHNWNLCRAFTVHGNEPRGYLRDNVRR